MADSIDWANELSLLPSDWALTPVKEKRPLRPSWQSEQPIDRDILLGLLRTGEDLSKSDGGTWHCTWTGIGLRLGTTSRNLMAVDVDGVLAEVKLNELSSGDIPETISWTSGRKGRSQILFLIPDEWVERISTVKHDCGEGQYLEFRWDGCQSVLPPSIHPETGRYQWINSPSNSNVAPAPQWLLDFVVSNTHRPAKPAEKIERIYAQSQSQSNTDTWSERAWALSYLDALAPHRADDYHTWIMIGMALHSVGDDSLLSVWDEWSSISNRYKPGKCEKKWGTFKRTGTGLGSLHHLAVEDGYQHPFKDSKSSHPPQKDSIPSSSPRTNSTAVTYATPSEVMVLPETEQTPEAVMEERLHKNLPPNVPDAESEILRLLLMGLCKELDVLGTITDPDVFYIPKHKIIFEAMLHLHKLGMPSNIVSVADVLRNNGKLNKVGGEQFLLDLTDSDYNRLRGDDVESYSRLLVDKWVRRELIKTALDISNLGSDQISPLDEILDQSEKLVYRLRNLTPNKDTRSAGEVANSTYEKLNNPNAIFPTGFPSLDNLLVGLEAETLTVVAARSSMGKTAFSLQALLQMSALHGKHCAYFSLEMPEEQLMHRIWCLMSNHAFYKEYNFQSVTGNQIRQHLCGIRPFSQEELDNITAIAALSTSLNFSINDSRNVTPTAIGSECRKLKSHYDNELGVVIIDYLQLFGGDGGDAAETSNRLLGVTRYFYNLAQELKCPVILLAQINRGPEGRNDKRPSMSDLAQSGGVEWIADNILMLYREGYYSTDNPDDPALEVICRKARQGATGTAKMCFDKERLLVYESPPGYY